MIDWATNRLALWSVQAYSLILQVYPCAFRREFGQSMTQVFRDMARDARQESGLLGLAVLWMRTVVDVLVSVVTAYASNRREQEMPVLHQLDRRVQRLSFIDVKLTSVSAFFFGLVVAKLFPEVLTLGTWWYVGLAVACIFHPVLLLLARDGGSPTTQTGGG